MKTILVTGGAGYVGSVLVPKLIHKGYHVKVLDLYLYGQDVLDSVRGHEGLTELKGDIRDLELLGTAMANVDAVIHLACISNDPSYELDPALGKSINYDAFIPLVNMAKKKGVKRFIYASSSSVYGIKRELNVTEDLSLEPLTDYSKYKAECEKVLLEAADETFGVTIIRPSTVCGYSPRLRLDLTVNILTNHAIHYNKIIVFGGEQMRPNIHIEDMTDLYVLLLEQPVAMVHKEIYNAGYENFKVRDIAEIVRQVLGSSVEVEVRPTNDCRSYHVCSEKIKRELGFVSSRTIQEAVLDLKRAFEAGKISDPMNNIRYYNIKTMQHVRLR